MTLCTMKAVPNAWGSQHIVPGSSFKQAEDYSTRQSYLEQQEFICCHQSGMFPLKPRAQRAKQVRPVRIIWPQLFERHV